MKRINIVLFTLALIFAGCDEFTPVFTGNYPLPEKDKIYTAADFEKITPISELAARYNYGSQQAVLIQDNIVISGKVSTDDQPGNFYKTMYIQDETGAIELKVGRNGLYNEYKPDKIIVSGGIANKIANISEASKMEEYLIEKGLDPELIIKEDNSMTTRENALYSVPIAMKYNPDTIIICSTIEHFTLVPYNTVKFFSDLIDNENVRLMIYTNAK